MRGGQPPGELAKDGACPDRVECPDGVPCRVDCVGDGSCAAGVDCKNASSCEVNCDGADSDLCAEGKLRPHMEGKLGPVIGYKAGLTAKGGGTAELSASGITTVKGSLVKVN